MPRPAAPAKPGRRPDGAAPIADLEVRIARMRQFNRFYTRQIGVLQEGLLDSPFSLTQSRVLYELANRDGPTATELAAALDLDAGYLSRVLRGFTKQKLVARARSADDNRHYHLTLTAAGRRAFATLDKHSHAQASATLTALSEVDRNRLLGAMETIETLLAPSNARIATPVGYVLRDPLPGDYGWVVHRQAALYQQEYGYDQRFEGLLASVIAEFVANFDPSGERCWIAERDGAVIGSVFLVRKSKEVAKLRMLYVEPSARGLGVGKRLVQECVRHARRVGYRTMTLWTQRVLVAARSIYEAEGFRLVDVHEHSDFGQTDTGEIWERAL